MSSSLEGQVLFSTVISLLIHATKAKNDGSGTILKVNHMLLFSGVPEVYSATTVTCRQIPLPMGQLYSQKSSGRLKE